MGYLSSSERTLRNLASFLLVFSFIAAVNSVIDIYYRRDDSYENDSSDSMKDLNYQQSSIIISDDSITCYGYSNSDVYSGSLFITPMMRMLTTVTAVIAIIAVDKKHTKMLTMTTYLSSGLMIFYFSWTIWYLLRYFGAIRNEITFRKELEDFQDTQFKTWYDDDDIDLSHISEKVLESFVGFGFDGKAVIDGETLSAQLRCEQFNMAIHFLGYSIIFVFFSLMSLYAWKCTKESVVQHCRRYSSHILTQHRGLQQFAVQKDHVVDIPPCYEDLFPEETSESKSEAERNTPLSS